MGPFCNFAYFGFEIRIYEWRQHIALSIGAGIYIDSSVCCSYLSCNLLANGPNPNRISPAICFVEIFLADVAPVNDMAANLQIMVICHLCQYFSFKEKLLFA